MAVAGLAALVSLGGTAWAAASLPSNSVGTSQLKAAAVTSPKFARGAVSAINRNQVQARISTACSGPSAAAEVSVGGQFLCNGTDLFARGGSRTRLTKPGQLVEVKKLTIRGSFLVLAYPEVSVYGNVAGQAVTVTCSLGLLSAGGPSTSGQLEFSVGQFRRTQAATIGLLLPLTSVPVDQNVGLKCSAAVNSGTTPRVLVTGAIAAVTLK